MIFVDRSIRNDGVTGSNPVCAPDKYLKIFKLFCSVAQAIVMTFRKDPPRNPPGAVWERMCRSALTQMRQHGLFRHGVALSDDAAALFAGYQEIVGVRHIRQQAIDVVSIPKHGE